MIRPDESNLIDLPGVGPCPRPVDIDQSVTGMSRLKSLRAYRFAPETTIAGESEVDEVLIVVLEGRISMEVSGASSLSAEFGPGQILYMPPDHAYRLTPLARCIVAYGRAEASSSRDARAITGTAAAGEVLHLRRLSLRAGEAVTLDAEALALVASGTAEALVASGAAEALAASGTAEALVASGAAEAEDAPMGPLSVLAVDAGSGTIQGTGTAEVWVYSA
ncbi:5-deoxy-glucuronate isomerase [Roseisalinus antarcticus]|uniref:5-deoxy-glucuronate isomerase n=1 Tax=Roseisalinus antarcticus TaxID=254357 RepID=UPI000A26DBD7|nr:5-deoxy-glucuronate isomerase [Roseisalinus antarcticus]